MNDGAMVAMLSEPTAVPIPKGLSVGGTQRDREASQGEQAEAAEREAAKQRILAQAEAERMPVEETTRAVPDRRWRRER